MYVFSLHDPGLFRGDPSILSLLAHQPLVFSTPLSSHNYARPPLRPLMTDTRAFFLVLLLVSVYPFSSAVPTAVHCDSEK